MLNNKKVVVVLPAYNAARTLRRTVEEIPREIVDEVILTDDASRDNTSDLAQELGLITIRHDHNRGYGGNQKTCYTAALARGADIVVMLHPDYQYTPKLVSAMASMIAYGEYDARVWPRAFSAEARCKGGMPLYKYIANRGLTFIENMLIWEKMSEYHTGYRAWSRELLERLPLLSCSDDFVFDNQMVVQAVYFGFRIGEISCPTKYFEEASSINFQRSVTYGFGVLGTAMDLRLKRWGLAKPAFLADVPYERLLLEGSGAMRSRFRVSRLTRAIHHRRSNRLQASNTVSTLRWMQPQGHPACRFRSTRALAYAIYALTLAVVDFYLVHCHPRATLAG